MATYNISLVCMKGRQFERLTHKGLGKRDLMMNFCLTPQDIPADIDKPKIVPANNFGDFYTVRRVA